MKLKRIMIVALLLMVILTIGAVSASEDSSILNDDEDFDDDSSLDEDDDSSVDVDKYSQIEVDENHTFEYIQGIIDDADDNSTFELSGYYAGNGTLINLNKNLTIMGNNATLDARYMSGIFNWSANNTVFKNIRFVNAKSDYSGSVINGTGFEFVNCAFINCTSSGYGGAVDGGTAVNCTFEGCLADYGGAISNAEVMNCSFISNQAYQSGGAVYNGVISYSIFNRNNARDGGAVAFSSVYRSEFYNNRASENGGAICDNVGGQRKTADKCIFGDNETDDLYNHAYHGNNMYGGIAVDCRINPRSSWSYYDTQVINNNRVVIYTDNITASVGDNVTITAAYLDYWGQYRSADILLNIHGIEYEKDTCIDYYTGYGPVSYNLIFDYEFDGDVYLYAFEEENCKATNVSHIKITSNAFTRTFTQLKEKIDYMQSGDTAYLNSNYKFDSTDDYVYRNGITIDKNLVIDGQGHVIDGNLEAPIFNVKSGYTVTFRNIIFINAHKSGDGAAISGGAAVDCKFIYNYATGQGGAIYNVNAKNCIFLNNFAHDGGAVSGGSVDDSVFKRNRAIDKGGAVLSSTVNNASFINNYALTTYKTQKGGHGGAVAYSEVYNSYFERNYVETVFGPYISSAGGAVYGGKIVNCTFNHHFAHTGATAYDAEAINCTFLNAYAAYYGNGGGMYRGKAYNCTFIKCEAYSDGGGMCGGSAYNCTFIDCDVHEEGGGMCDGSAYYCTFIRCNADGYGGGACYSNLYSCVFINNTGPYHHYNDGVGCAFAYCNVFNEWNITCYEIDSVLVYLESNFYHEYTINASDVHGLDEWVTFNITVLDFKGRPANGYSVTFRYLNKDYEFDVINGIATASIYIPKHDFNEQVSIEYTDPIVYYKNDPKFNVIATTDLEYKSFSELKTLIESNDDEVINLTDDYVFNPKNDRYYIEINRNLTINGNNHIINGFYKTSIFTIVDGANVIINNVSFVHNYGDQDAYRDEYYWDNAFAVNAEYGNVTVINSSFDYGIGAIYHGNAINCVFTNMSSLNGGAIYDGTARNCTFIDCYARYGGAIARSSASDSIFIRCSGVHGGAAYSSDISNCTFIDCHASYGGAISKSSASDATFRNCQASYDGGAAYSSDISDCSFIGCYADGDGGAVYYSTVSDSTFNNCIALYNGGGASGGNCINSTFIECSAGNSSGAIHNCENSGCTFINCTEGFNYYTKIFVDGKSSKDIQKAIKNAAVGNIIVLSGYFECDYSIYINKQLTIIGDDAILDAKGNNRIFYIDYAKGVVIDNLKFVNANNNNGGAIYIYSDSSYKPQNISVSDSGVTISNPYVTIINSTFINCTAYDGGAIYNVYSSTSYCVNCTFIDCDSKNCGGAIYSGIASNCTFIDCSAGYHGAALYNCIDGGCTFINCEWGSNYNTVIVVEGSSFNDIKDAIDGALNGNVIILNGSYYAQFEITVNKDLTIIGNNTTIYSYSTKPFNAEGSNAVFKNINFLDCGDDSYFYPVYGGAINGGTAINCTFTNCYSNGGGATYNVKVINCTFKNCQAYSHYYNRNVQTGFAVSGGSVVNCTFHILNFTDVSTLFEGYSPSEYIGSSDFNYITDDNSTVILVKPFDIKDTLSISVNIVSVDIVNEGVAYLIVNGEAVSERDVVNGIANFEYTITKRGYYEAYVVYVDENGVYAPSIALAMESTKFNGTTQTFTELKALIDSAEGTTVVLNSDYEFDPDSDSILVDGISLKNIERIEGNGHKIDASGLARIFSADAKTLSLNNITFANGYHKTNPVMRISRSGSYEITDCIFINCTSTTNVGALHVPKQASMIIDNSVFMDITGGAIRALGTVSVNNSMFLNCHSESYGGAMYKGTAYDSTFVNCSSSRYGVIYSGLCYDCTFDNCTELEDANLKVEAHDINQSEVETVTVSIDKLAVGNVIVLVDDMIYPVTVTNGAGKVDISDLSVGEHTIYVTFANDGSFKPSTVSTNITVIGGGLDSNLEAFVNDVEEGQDVQINVTINENVKGKVTVIIGEITENIEITNGKGSVNISGLTGGEYTAIVKFTGDDTFKASRKEMTFKVNKSSSSETNITVEPEIEIPSLDNVTDDEGIVVSLPADATGTVTLTVNGKDYIFEVVDGKADVKLPELDNGDYPYTITYSGDSKYSSFNSSGSMNVNIASGNGTSGNASDINGTSGNATGVNVTVEPEIEIPSLDNVSGEGNVVVSLPADATGTVTLTVNGKDYIFEVVDGKADVKLPDLGDGDYPYTITYSGDGKYSSFTDNGNIKVNNTAVTPVGNETDVNGTGNQTGENTTKPTPEIVVPPMDKPSEDGSVTVSLPADATGTVTLTVNGKDYVFDVVNGKADVKLPELGDGDYPYTITYSGDSKYSSFTDSGSMKVNNTSITPVGNETDKNTTDDNDTNASQKIGFGIEFFDDYFAYGETNILGFLMPKDIEGSPIVLIDGNQYSCSEPRDSMDPNSWVWAGDSQKNGYYVYFSDLKPGNHEVIISYPGDSKYDSSSIKKTITVYGEEVDNSKITASNVKVTYSAGSYYTIKVYGADGKLANGETVKVTGKISKSLTTNNGVAKFKIDQAPGTYKITITALNKKVTKTITVKHLVTLKTATVKKSAKKLVLQANLAKVNKKYLKNKKVTFKFNGKKYTAKTNAKGVAKVTILSSVLKKLKVGKKVTYQATYLKDTVKKTAKIKK